MAIAVARSMVRGSGILSGNINCVPMTSELIESFAHPDQFPDDVVKFFADAERQYIEFGSGWYRNLVDSVFVQDAGVRFFVLRIDGAVTIALPVRIRRSRGATHVEALSNFYTAVYAPAIGESTQASHMSRLIRGMQSVLPRLASFKLWPMDPQSASYRVLREGLAGAGFRCFDYFCFGNWYLRVDSDWPSYLAQRAGAVRSTIKRMGKKFAAEGGRLELGFGGPDLGRQMAAYNEVYAASWKVPEPYPAFVPGLIEACAQRGWLRIGVAWLGDKPIAAQLWYVASGRAHIYKLAYHDAYKHLAPGTLLTAKLFEHVIEQDHVHEVDYLIGDDPYKQAWMSDRRERWGLVAYNPSTLVGMMGLARELLGRFAKQLRQTWFPDRNKPPSGSEAKDAGS